MDVPGLGEVFEEADYGWHRSQPVSILMFGGQECEIVLVGYEEDAQKEDFHTAIGNFLTAGSEVLRKADASLFEYYKDHEKYLEGSIPEIKNFDQLWKHVRFAGEALISRRHYADQRIYVSLECGCDWEREHGLEIVLKEGCIVNKLGPYDGHLENSDAYGDARFENTVYVRHADFSV